MKFLELVTVLERIQKTSKRLEKTAFLATFLQNISPAQYEQTILLVQGKVYPEYDATKLGISHKLVLKALATATGLGEKTINAEFNKAGDVGVTAYKVLGNKHQNTLFSEELSVNRVFKSIQKLASFTGKQSVADKVSVMAGLLGSSTALEAKYLCNIIVEQLRVGVAQGVLRDAVLWSIFPGIAAQAYPEIEFSWKKAHRIPVRTIEEIQEKPITAYDALVVADPQDVKQLFDQISTIFQRGVDVSSSISFAAQILSTKGVKELSLLKIQLYRPFHVMLAQKAPTISEGIKAIGLPLIAEYKYDGFRMQIHVGKNIRLFTRRLEEVTAQFPDVVERLKKSLSGKNLILDAEIVGVDKKTGKYLAFQNISQRIRRKYDIKELSDNFPVEIRVFDILLEGNTLFIDQPLRERRKILESVISEQQGLGLSSCIIAENEEQVNTFYAQSLAAGNEGIMLKKIDSPYQPGSRVGFMLKCKPVMENLDLVIIKATRGEGKRSQWFTSFTVACKNDDGELLELGKVSTGLKEIDEEGTSFSMMTQLLQPLMLEDHGKEIDVDPKIVIEVAYEEIQKSNAYSSGYALRFPRFIFLREDRGIDDISDITYIDQLYEQQRGRNT